MTAAKRETIGARLLRHRQNAGLTIPQLAEKSGVATGTISDVENNRSDFRVSTLVALLTALGQLNTFKF
jgi:transcriptional regulator with XRE-family HTH domain